jgi:CHRD domain
MRKIVFALALLAALPLVAQTGTCNTTQRFSASLLGSNLGTSGAPNAFASALLTVDGNSQATITSRTLGLANVTGLQLYRGAPGPNGVIVQTFTDADNAFTGGTFTRTMAIDPALLAQILANPSNYYFVITTTDFPNGAVSGQLSGANAQYFAGSLAGANGAPNGSGNFVLALTPAADGGSTLRYDIATSGIGNNVSELRLGAAGGAPIVLGSGLTASNGRITGTASLTAAQAQLLQCNASTLTMTLTTPAFASGAVVGSVGTGNEVFIPVAGTIRGANNTNWMTDLNVFNASPSASANTFIQFFASGQDNTAGAQNVNSLTIPARGTSATRDISTGFFGGAQSGIGALRIISTSNVFANARIYNNQTANGQGTFGQSVPGLTRGEALSGGVLVGLTSGTASHTNLGFFNPSDAAVTVALELRDASGNVRATRLLTLAPWAQSQQPLGAVFNTLEGDVATSAVDFVSGSPLFVYASVVDNTSGDASFITPRSDG